MRKRVWHSSVGRGDLQRVSAYKAFHFLAYLTRKGLGTQLPSAHFEQNTIRFDVLSTSLVTIFCRKIANSLLGQ